MTDTARLGLPLLAAAQAQKHVTHNEALLLLDALVQGAVLDKDLAAPPASPAEGARYLVAAAPTGAWAGRAGAIAIRQDGTWTFATPQAGFVVYVADEATLYLHDGTAWAPLAATISRLQNLSRLGIGTEADAGNPLSAKLNAALWTAKAVGEGGSGDLRYTLNKEGAGHVLSLLFQSGYSGRLELGLIGSDSPSLKVSADGTTWRDALTIDGATGRVSLASAPSAGGSYLFGTDNTFAFGSPSSRATTVYAASGLVSTSDARAKTAVEPLSEAELAAASDLAREIGTYRFLEAVRDKGEAARLHAGLAVQRAMEILTGHGLDPSRYGFICRDAWSDGPQERDLLGFRTDELLLLMTRGLERRLAVIEARLPA